MAKFKPGQEVVCTVSVDWQCNCCGDKILGPKKDEIVTVQEYSHRLGTFFTPTEYQEGVFPENAFEPVVSQEIIEELLEHMPKPLEV